jgi:hypothetical protein
MRPLGPSAAQLNEKLWQSIANRLSDLVVSASPSLHKPLWHSGARRAVLLPNGHPEANRGNRKVPGEHLATEIMTAAFLQQMVARGVRFPPQMCR